MKFVAKAFLINGAGEILVLRRSATHPHFAYHLDFPGGEVEEGEAHSEAAAREVLEESGLQLPASSLHLVHQTQAPSGTVELVFVGKLANAHPKVTLSWEHDQFEWLTAEQLLSKPIPAGVDNYYKTALEYLRSSTLH
jgi:8-oxo-dGTP diphosphatase